MYSIDLSGKKGVVLGVANHRSIAWSIAKKLAHAGAEITFTYQTERLRDLVAKTVSELGSPKLFECDVSDEDSVKAVFETIGTEWKQIDFIVHSVAYADKDDLSSTMTQVSAENFAKSLNVSSYSLVTVMRNAAPYLTDTTSVVTLSFGLQNRVYPGYNLMGTAKSTLINLMLYLASEFGERGIRINAISAGALPTLAARSIPNFKEMQKYSRDNSLLKRNITHEEVANTALFLVSNMSSGITATTIPVNAGMDVRAS